MDSDTKLKDVVLTGVRSVESAELKVVEDGNKWKMKRSQLGKVVLYHTGALSQFLICLRRIKRPK